MKNIKRYLIFAAVFSVLAMNAQESSFDKELKLWKKSPVKNISIDKEVKVAGSGSVRLNNQATLFREFPLKADTNYELTFFVKGENIDSSKGQGGRVMLFDGRKKWGRVTSRVNSGLETGTFDWRQGKAEIKSPDWGEKIRISLALRGNGTIWFDEVELKEMGKIHKRDSFRNSFNDDYQELAMVPQGVLGFFEPGEKIEFKIFCKSKAKKLEYTFTVKDENGIKITSVPLRALEDKFELPGQPCGYYVVEADFYADGKKSRSLQSAFVVNRKFEKRDPFFQMGFGVHPLFYEGYKRIGVGMISMKFSFFMPNRSAEQLWEIAYNNYKKFLDSKDFKLSAAMPMPLRKDRILRSQQELAEGWPYISDDLLQKRKEYIELIMKNIKGKVQTVIFQEEISSSATIKNKYVGNWPEAMSNYLILARMGARQVRKIDPSVKIHIGGNNVQACLRNTEPLVMGALVNEFDQYVIDGYTGNWDLSKGKPTIPEGSLMSFLSGGFQSFPVAGQGEYHRQW